MPVLRQRPDSIVLVGSILFVVSLLLVKVSGWGVFALISAAVLLYGLVGGRTYPHKVADSSLFITGAGSGLGRGFALEAARMRASLIHVSGRRLEPLQETKALIEQHHGSKVKVVVHHLDITDSVAVERLCGQVIKDHGCPDIIINNAGLGDWKHIEDTSPAEALAMTSAPYLGAFSVTRAFVPTMIARGSGHILNVTSLASILPIRSAVTYAVARSAMRFFSQSLAEDLHETKIGVTCLNSPEISGTDYFINNSAAIPPLFTLPIVTMFNKGTNETAAVALEGMEAGEKEVIPCSPAVWPAVWLYNLMPELVLALLRIGDVGLRSEKKTNLSSTATKEE